MSVIKSKSSTDNTASMPVPKKGKATILSQKVAEVLMHLRQTRRMSQRAFAEHIGVSFQQYQKYEKGRDRLSLEKAMLLCSQLGLSLDVFMEPDQSTGNTGFSESEQAGFENKTLGKDEQEVLDIFAQIPLSARDDFLETLRQLAKMTAKKS